MIENHPDWVIVNLRPKSSHQSRLSLLHLLKSLEPPRNLLILRKYLVFVEDFLIVQHKLLRLLFALNAGEMEADFVRLQKCAVPRRQTWATAAPVRVLVPQAKLRSVPRTGHDSQPAGRDR